MTIPRENNKIPGNIDTLYYNKDCSIKLEKKTGTIHMLKTALQYVYDNYPYVKEYELQDESHINEEKIGKPLITSKRLLYSKPGWYQEYLGAEPINYTPFLIEYIKEKQTIIHQLIKKYKPSKNGDDWFVPLNILLITDNIPPTLYENRIFSVSGKIFGTPWKITRNTISNYGIDYDIIKENTEDIYDNYYKNHVNIHEHDN